MKIELQGSKFDWQDEVEYHGCWTSDDLLNTFTFRSPSYHGKRFLAELACVGEFPTQGEGETMAEAIADAIQLSREDLAWLDNKRSEVARAIERAEAMLAEGIEVVHLAPREDE